MRKTLLYLALLAVLGTGVYFFLFRSNEGLYREHEANFTIRDTGAIGKIFMVQNDGESLLLERGKDNEWTVNKEFPAMPVQVFNLLSCLKAQTALMPVSEKDHDRVVKLLAGMGTKVEIYNRQGEKTRSFYVAGQGANYHGSYMIIEGADQPYLVEVTGFKGYLTPRFSTDINAWRARRVFHTPAEQIRSVHVQYDEEPLSSFTVVQENGQVRVDIDPSLHEIATELNEERVHQYLDLFSDINNEGYLNGALYMDSAIANTTKRGTITLTSVKGEPQVVDIYWMSPFAHIRHNVATVTDEANRPKDVDRMYAILHNTHDTMAVQFRTFDPLLRRSYEFYAKDSVKKESYKPAPLR